MNAEVVTVSSRVPTEPYYHLGVFLESLRRFAEVPTNIGEGCQWRGLMTKPYLLREWLRAGKNRSDRLIVCDAWDIIFVQHPHGIGDRCAELWGDAVVFNGEKGCWPREDLRGAFPDDGSPWRFLNSGFMCGPADKILALVEAMDIERVGFDPPGGPYPNDQGEYQALFALQSRPLKIWGYPVVDSESGEAVPEYMHGVKMVVDTQCVLAQTGSACTLDEFDFSGPQIVNRLTGTTPGVWHFNGGAKELLMPAVRKKLNL